MANGKDIDEQTGGEAGIGSGRYLPMKDPTELTTRAIYREIAGLRELVEQKIESLDEMVKREFELVERQRLEQKGDTTVALNASFAAAQRGVELQTEASEKSIGKQEASTNKAIDQLRETFAVAIKSIEVTIGEVKERVTAMEQQKIGAKEDRSGLYAAIGIAATLVIVGIAVIGFFAAYAG